MVSARIVVGNSSDDLFDHRRSSCSILLRRNGSSSQRVGCGLEVLFRPDASATVQRRVLCSVRCYSTFVLTALGLNATSELVVYSAARAAGDDGAPSSVALKGC